MGEDLPSLPYEVVGSILRFAIKDLVYELRRVDTDISYAARLRRWADLRLTSKMFYNILSEMNFQGVPVQSFLRAKQLEKLDYGIQFLFQLVWDENDALLTLPLTKFRHFCGKFWFNPDLSKECVLRVFSTLYEAVHSFMNFVTKLESWILRNKERSSEVSTDEKGVLCFEIGDWKIQSGHLLIRRVSRWNWTGRRTRTSLYLAREMGVPNDPVHMRLGHDRRWYLTFRDSSFMVNYETKMVYDLVRNRLFDFTGSEFEAETSDDDFEGTDGGIIGPH
jgi:hypothetical protein